MRNTRTDSGWYNRPAQIQAPAAFVSDGQGGNANAGQWSTIRSPMIRLQSRLNGRGFNRGLQYDQLYPTATHWAECRYAHDETVDASMTMLIDGRRFQIIGVVDVELEHVTTLLVLEEWQAQGSK